MVSRCVYGDRFASRQTPRLTITFGICLDPPEAASGLYTKLTRSNTALKESRT